MLDFRGSPMCFFFGGGRFLTLRLKLKNIYCSITIDYKYPVSIFMILWLIIFYFLFRYLLMQHLGQTYVLQQHHLITSNSNLRCESFGHSCHDPWTLLNSCELGVSKKLVSRPYWFQILLPTKIPWEPQAFTERIAPEDSQTSGKKTNSKSVLR